MYAINLADAMWLKANAEVLWSRMVQPVATDELVKAEKAMDGMAIVLNCPDEQVEAMMGVIRLARERRRLPRATNPVRFYLKRDSRWQRVTA